jgi:hypothetical protein
MNTRELLVKILDIYGILDKYVILKEDEKGRYIEYAFKEGAPKDNRCLSWYDKPHPKARVRNGYRIDYPIHEVGKIYQLGLFSCGHENLTGDDHCSAGHPKLKCLVEGCALYWTYEEPVKCACWHLTSTDIETIEDVPFLGGKSILELESLLSK